MVSGYPKSIGIPQVDGLSTGPPSFGASKVLGSRNKNLVYRKGLRPSHLCLRVYECECYMLSYCLGIMCYIAQIVLCIKMYF